MAVFLGLGDGSLSSPRLFPVAGNPPSAAVADGDGDVDAVTVNGVVLLNTPY